MKKKSIPLAFFTIFMLLILSLAMISCQNETTSTSSGGQTTTESGETSSGNEFDELSLEGITLTFWRPLLWTGKVSSNDENDAWEEVQERLGVTLDFITPTAGNESEQFNLMIAGDTLPDLISTGWSGDALYTGGLDKYVRDGVLIELNEIAPIYAPDYVHVIQTKVSPDQQKDFYTDNGSMVQFYAISPYEEFVYNGLQYRKDWMEELDLDNPKTLAEVEVALTAFKDQMGASSPMILSTTGIDGQGGCFLSAFDIGPSFYQKDGSVMYGPIQTEFKEYLLLMNDWYEKGLIDQDFASRDEDAWKRMLTTGETGAIVHSPDTVGAWMEEVADMMGGYNPVKNPGDKINYRLKNFQCRPPYAAAITTACETPEAAAKFLNYGYTEAGWMLYNYGIEGETYNIVDGEVVYTDMMMDNPEYPVLDAILKYKVHIGPFLRFEHEGNPAINQNTMAIRQFWTETSGTDLVMPMVTLTADEGTEFARIMNQVNTYLSTATLQFIMGVDSIEDNFDAYVADLERLEIQKAIDMQQAALDRYNQR